MKLCSPPKKRTKRSFSDLSRSDVENLGWMEVAFLPDWESQGLWEHKSTDSRPSLAQATSTARKS